MTKNKGWRHTEAAKAKMRAAATGRKASAATRKKMSEAQQAIWQKIKASGCLRDTAA